MAKAPLPLCLSRQELRDLTRTPLKTRQIAFPRTNGIRHYLDSHGRPVVLRSAVENHTPATPTPAPRWTPNKVT